MLCLVRPASRGGLAVVAAVVDKEIPAIRMVVEAALEVVAAVAVVAVVAVGRVSQ